MIATLWENKWWRWPQLSSEILTYLKVNEKTFLKPNNNKNKEKSDVILRKMLILCCTKYTLTIPLIVIWLYQRIYLLKVYKDIWHLKIKNLKEVRKQANQRLFPQNMASRLSSRMYLSVHVNAFCTECLSVHLKLF